MTEVDFNKNFMKCYFERGLQHKLQKAGLGSTASMIIWFKKKKNITNLVSSNCYYRQSVEAKSCCIQDAALTVTDTFNKWTLQTQECIAPTVNGE